MRNEVGRIEEFIEQRIGEMRGISEWCYEINNTLRPKKRFTNKELAFVFNKVIKNRGFSIDYRSAPIQYAFYH